MSNEIAVAIITGIFTFAGVLITVVYGNKKTAQKITDQHDVTMYRLDQLEKKQDKHNSVIERTYALEEKVAVIEEKIKVENHRIDDLEGYHKHGTA